MNQHPKYLPNIETVEDILLDIKDTDDYKFGNIEIGLVGNYAGRWNSTLYKVFQDYPLDPSVEVKVFYEAVMPKSNLCYSYDDSIGCMPTLSVQIKKTEYRILKLLYLLDIKYYSNISEESHYIIEDTIDRIKDYLEDSNILKIERIGNNFKILHNIYDVTILGSSVG